MMPSAPTRDCLGFSFYSTASLADNQARIQRFASRGIGQAFTSLNLTPVYDEGDFETLMAACRQAGVAVMADINAQSLARYGVERLKGWGLAALRVDDGLTASQMAQLSQGMPLVLNASTVTSTFLQALREAGVALDHVWAAHNYYPKRYSGLSSDSLRQQNARLAALGIPCLAFISGTVRREPYGDGLCTVEETRDWPAQQAALHLLASCGVNRVYLGDYDVTDDQLDRLLALNQGVVDLSCQAPAVLCGRVWSNRPDPSDWVIRVSETRQALAQQSLPGAIRERPRGSLVLGRPQYGRYANELEICLQDLPRDDRQAVVGQVAPQDVSLLPYIRGDWRQFRLRLHE